MFALVVTTSIIAVWSGITHACGKLPPILVESFCVAVWFTLLFLDSSPVLPLKGAQRAISFLVHAGFVLWLATFLAVIAAPSVNFLYWMFKEISDSVSN